MGRTSAGKVLTVKCQFPAEDISAYLDGELSPADAARVEAHLRTCASCSQLAEELTVIARSLRQRPAPVMPGDVIADRRPTDTAAAQVRELSCERAGRLLSEYVDQELSPRQVAEVEQHIFGCEQCYQQYREYETLAETLSTRPAVPSPAGLTARIYAALDEVDRRPAGLAAWREALQPRSLWPAAGIAAAAILLLAVWFAGWRPGAMTSPGSAPVVAEAPAAAAPRLAARPIEPQVKPESALVSRVAETPAKRRRVPTVRRATAIAGPSPVETSVDLGPPETVAAEPAGTVPAPEAEPAEPPLALRRVAVVAVAEPEVQPVIAPAPAPAEPRGPVLATVEITSPPAVDPGPRTANHRSRPISSERWAEALAYASPQREEVAPPPRVAMPPKATLYSRSDAERDLPASLGAALEPLRDKHGLMEPQEGNIFKARF